MNRLRIGIFFLLTLASAARADIEFVGILVMSGKSLFALTDTTASKTDWVALQGGFAGYVVTRFDQATDTLTLTRNGANLRVRLKDDAKIKAARFELTGAITLGAGEKIEIERATLVFDQENVFPLKEGIVYRVTPTRQPDGNHLFRIVIERRSADNRIERISAPSVITLPDHTFMLNAGEFAFSFTPKSPQ